MYSFCNEEEDCCQIIVEFGTKHTHFAVMGDSI